MLWFKPLHILFKSSLERYSQRVDSNMPFMAHVAILRKHLIRVVIWLFLGFCFSFYWIEPLIRFLQTPLKAQTLLAFHVSIISTEVFEVVMTNLKVCFFVGLIAVLPLILWELWRFISPALYKSEKIVARNLILFSSLLFYLGIFAGYQFMVPLFLENTLGFASQFTQVTLTFKSYFNTLILLTLVFGFVFEVPVILFLLMLGGILDATWLEKNRRISIVVCFILGAILSPPDVFSLFLVSIPLLIMVEFSIFFLKKYQKRKDILNSSNKAG